MGEKFDWADGVWSDNIPEPLRRAYIASAGWAAAVDHDLEAGFEFDWEGVRWEVAAVMRLPCCGTATTLVRRVGSGLDEWRGVSCGTPVTEKCGTSYTIELERPKARAVES